MGGLLHNARKFFQGFAPAATPARAQSFSVACSEGHRLTGQRTDGYQALRCPTCGEGLFVLPRSPLPEPSVPADSAADVARRPGPAGAWDDSPVPLEDPLPQDVTSDARDDDPDDAEGEIEWVDEPEPGRVPGASPEDLAEAEIAARAAAPREPAEVRRRSSTRPQGAVARRKAEGPSVETVPEPQRPRVPIGERVWRNKNPLIFLTVALVVAATVAIRVYRDRRQSLPLIAEQGRVEGLAALDAGQFDKANQILSRARRAVIELGGAYQGASAILQGADEAAIIAGLVTSPLEDVLDEAARADPKDWPKRFDTFYKGRTALFDVQVERVPDGQGNGRYEIDYRIFPEGEGVPRRTGRVDLSGFRLFELVKPRVGDRLRFGARIASFRFDSDSDVWVLGFEPESGVIMTHEKALEALGWRAEEPETEGRP